MRHATNADREMEEMQRKSHHHDRLKATYEEVTASHQTLKGRIQSVRNEIQVIIVNLCYVCVRESEI